MQTDTYRIPVRNFQQLEEKLAKLNKRAEKLGCAPLKLNVVNTITEARTNPVLNVTYNKVRFYECQIEGEAPKLEGWTLVAVLEPKGEEILIREIPGQHCPPKFRTTDLRCEHCGSVRRRNHVFVLKHDDHRFCQVGRTCLGDFLGHISPERMLSYVQNFTNVVRLCGEAGEADWSGGPDPVETDQFVTVAAVLVRTLGWVPKSKADGEREATSSLAWSICAYPEEDYTQQFVRRHALTVLPEDLQLAEAALKWGRAISPDKAPNNYMHDLGVCCRQTLVDRKTAGFTASVVAAYQNHLQVERQKRLAKRRVQRGYLGQIGVRQEFGDLTLMKVRYYMAGMYPKTLLIFEDEVGNVVLWRASGTLDWPQEGKVYSVKATVEEHTEYNGTPQTVVKRLIAEEAATTAS